MFTGIVEETGVVDAIKPTANAIGLTVRTDTCARGLKIGDSVAVNGCCLTVCEIAPRKSSTRRAHSKSGSKNVRFDLLKETWKRTNLQFARVGSLVNLERALQVGGRVGGHFVTGHIDGTGKISRWERSGLDYVLDIEAPPELMRYIVFKGSICVDGISLTVAAVRRKSFRVWIIPHTYEVTALKERKVGAAVNLEADLLGKYVERLLESR